MYGILINPFKKTVTKIEIGKTIDDVYSALTNLDIGKVDMVQVLGSFNSRGNGQDLWLDEEGLFKAGQKKFAFLPFGFQQFRGKALILGKNKDGTEWDDTALTVSEVSQNIIWE